MPRLTPTPNRPSRPELVVIRSEPSARKSPTGGLSATPPSPPGPGIQGSADGHGSPQAPSFAVNTPSASHGYAPRSHTVDPSRCADYGDADAHSPSGVHRHSGVHAHGAVNGDSGVHAMQGTANSSNLGAFQYNRQASGGAGPAPSGPVPAMSDAALVEQARNGHVWAQEALFHRHSRMVLGLSQRILAGRDDAEDLAQDVFVYALGRLDTLNNPQAFSSWLGSIVVRTASKRLRRQRLMVRLGLRRNEPIDPNTVVSRTAPPDVGAELRVVYGMLNGMPAEQRIALVLRRVEGMELKEIADHMGLSLATVKRRLSDAEGRLERAMARL